MLVPYITVGLCVCVWQHIEFTQMIYGRGFVHLWFLLTIFECYVLFRIIDFVFTRKRCLIIIIISYVVILISKMYPIHLPHIGLLMYLGPYYATGMALSRLYDMDIMNDARKLLVILLVSVALYIAGVLLIHEQSISYVLALNVIIAIFLYLGTVQKDMMTASMLKLDEASMGIYIFQQIYILAINTIPCVHSFMIHHYFIYPNLLFVVVLPLSYLTVIILKRWNWSKYIIG